MPATQAIAEANQYALRWIEQPIVERTRRLSAQRLEPVEECFN